jgi:acetyl-CoA synthetase
VVLGGKLNVCFNCVDRTSRPVRGGGRVPLGGEPEGETRTITYADLQKDVVRFANALKKLGVKKGRRSGSTWAWSRSCPVAMLACTRLGAPHTVVFGGFSADSLSGRMNDMKCEVLITQDEAWRRGSKVGLKTSPTRR